MVEFRAGSFFNPLLRAAYGLLLVLNAGICFADPYVGSEQCKTCHEQAFTEWQGSHHDWAMKPATEEFVLGDFNNVTFDHFGETTTFSHSEGKYFITTLNARAEEETFQVAYTFGFYPLQQYLLAGPGGRYQAFTIAWDSRPKTEGGQRWFHLYPDEATPPEDVLHWTGTYFTWNNRCADCHSTNLAKNFSAQTNRYSTTWSEINVACEACHGPGEAHLEWAAGKSQVVNKGLPERLNPVAKWLDNKDQPTLKSDQTEPAQITGQLAVCGRCHSRRSPKGDVKPGEAFDQNYELQLPQTPLYHADGQIQDEVYVLGSFMQSKMFQNGVVCSNCHNPHSLALKLPGNAVCAQCHKPSVFDTPAHHHHKAGTTGAACVDCHMPTTTYMQVDPRRDHSLRIPRPDLSERAGVPNACNQCHDDKSAGWASDHIAAWRKAEGKTLPAHFSDLLIPGLTGQAGSQDALAALAYSNIGGTYNVPDIVQAAAVAGLANYAEQQSLSVAKQQLRSVNPMIRAAAVNVFALLPLAQRREDLLPLITDNSRLVRDAVVQSLAGLDTTALTPEQRQHWLSATREYEQTLAYHADSAAGQMNIGLYQLAQGNLTAAEQAYEQALLLDPFQLGAYLNLADLYRQLNQDTKGWAVLNRGFKKLPEAAALYHAAGLLKVRQKAYGEAEGLLAKAATLSPQSAQYAYMYGLILQHEGNDTDAVTEWERALAITPTDQQLLMALLQTYRRLHDWEAALRVATQLQALSPNNPQLEALVQRLRASQAQP